MAGDSPEKFRQPPDDFAIDFNLALLPRGSRSNLTVLVDRLSAQRVQSTDAPKIYLVNFRRTEFQKYVKRKAALIRKHVEVGVIAHG
jgi:hypothetical protein